MKQTAYINLTSVFCVLFLDEILNNIALDIKAQQNNLLIELATCTANETSESGIINKSIPLYKAILQCTSINILKRNQTGELLEIDHPSCVKSKEWTSAKTHFIKNNYDKKDTHLIKDQYFYHLPLCEFGLLIFSTTKPIAPNLIKSLKPICQTHGKLFMLASNKEQLLETQASLLKSHKIQKLSLEINHASVFWNNFEDGTVSSTPHLYYFLGYSKDELPKTIEEATAMIHIDDIPKVLTAFNSHIEGKVKEYYCEFRMRSKIGKWVWVDGRGKIISQNKDGKPKELLGISQVITKRKNAEMALIKEKERAEESDRLKSIFLANMSHEIRTPMNGILGFAQLLKEPHLDTEAQHSYVEIIENSGQRMLSIINDLIDLSKIEAGQMNIIYSSFKLSEVLDYIYNFFKPGMEKKGLQFELKMDGLENDVLIHSDKEKVIAILSNLVNNAMKYTNEGAVTLSTSLNKDSVYFKISDTGIGISPAHQKIIFNRFVQSTEVDLIQKKEGVGLGLAICKAYIELLKGEIGMDSTTNDGSNFYFTIPRIECTNPTL